LPRRARDLYTLLAEVRSLSPHHEASMPRPSATHRKIAIFPGTFDPLTLGHLDIIDRGRKLFDELIVAIGINPEKNQLFPVEERLEILRSVTKKFRNVSVEAYEGLTVTLVKRRKAAAILRGLRNLADLDYEFRIALTNRKVAGVETVFIMTREEFGFTSSSLIKQIVTLGGDPKQLRELLPERVIQRLTHYRDNRLGPFAAKPKDVI
jgi:pantetheine-phosphate adenylyltransferase